MPWIGKKSFARDDRGAVAATYALALTALIIAAGAGFDYSRMATLDSELQNGADQAALAGATQLDGKAGACSRAAARASSLVNNLAIMATNQTLTVANEATCDGVGSIQFFQDKSAATPATDDSNARYIAVVVDQRTVNYALTPIGNLLFANVQAAAVAGLGSSVCKVPPVMICSPDPSQPFNANAKRGWGVQATGHGNDRSGKDDVLTGKAWAPGDFGFLEVGGGANSDLLKMLAFKQIPFDCVPVDGTKPETGNPQGLYDAVNVRFDIYDFPSGGGTVLAPCFSGACPAALNTVKDLVKKNENTSGNACKLQNNGWELPADDRQFWPKATTNADGTYNDFTHSSQIDAMGLPRDLCHYTSFGTACTNGATGRFGNGVWARRDYFAVNHPGGERPANPDSISRYDTYKWELANNNMPYGLSAGSNKQYGRPVCSTGTVDGLDRRVMTVAVVKNCASLNGAANAVEVDEWVDMFLVEPVVDARGNGANKDSIYMEVIGPSTLAGGGAAAQQIRRDVPYLVR